MDLNPLNDIAQRMQYQNLEKRMDNIYESVSDIEACMKLVRTNIEILIRANADLTDSINNLNERLANAENLMEGTKHDKI